MLDVVHLDDDASSSNERARYALRTADGEEILATNVAVACGAWPDCVREGLALDVPVVPVRGTECACSTCEQCYFVVVVAVVTG